jgi:hypothetical protein
MWLSFLLAIISPKGVSIGIGHDALAHVVRFLDSVIDAAILAVNHLPLYIPFVGQ